MDFLLTFCCFLAEFWSMSTVIIAKEELLQEYVSHKAAQCIEGYSDRPVTFAQVTAI